VNLAYPVSNGVGKMKENYNSPEHFWPSRELVSVLGSDQAPDYESGRVRLVGALFNALGKLPSVSAYMEGCYVLFENKGQIHPFFADQLHSALQIQPQSSVSSQFQRLLGRDLHAALADGHCYGPASTFLFVDERGLMQAALDYGSNRHPYRPQPAIAKIA